MVLATLCRWVFAVPLWSIAMRKDDSERFLEDEVEMALLRRDQKDRRAWGAGYTNRVMVIGPNNLFVGGHETFYVSSERMLSEYLRQLSVPLLTPSRLQDAGVDMCVLPLCDRNRDVQRAKGFAGELLLRAMSRGFAVDVSFYATDLVDTTDAVVMDNFWVHATLKLRERYKWPQGQFTMIDALPEIDNGLVHNTPHVCVFRSNHRLASVVLSKSILIMK